jgi:hypothetical protein
MKNVTRFVFLLVVIVIVGAVLFLSTWDIPAPSVEVEKVILNDKFPK